MTLILSASGFKNLETLQDFLNRFPDSSNFLDEELQKVWICHKNQEEIPKLEDVNSLPSIDYNHLLIKVKEKIASGKSFCSLLTEFSALNIFNQIFFHCKKPIATYLFTKCYLFYNWGTNAFEPVIDHFEIHSRIQKMKNKSLKINHRSNFISREYSRNVREKSVDIFEGSGDSIKQKKFITKKFVMSAKENTSNFYESVKNSENPFQKTFNLKKILYDMKQRPQWPRNNILSKRNVNDLIIFIIKIPLETKIDIGNKIWIDHENWVLLKYLLNEFIKRHQRICVNYDGYGRILKRHLKKMKAVPDRRLQPIPKSIVTSYIFDILRRVLPMELFGGNSTRRHFFRELAKIIKGNKDEKYIWINLLQAMLKNKANLFWCLQINGTFAQNLMLLKLFKFLIIHYVLVLLRKNFYITETGSSGFGLRYFRKSDMESAVATYVNQLIKSEQIRLYSTKNDHIPSSIERTWINTGVIPKEDLKKNIPKKMNSKSEYIQPIARARFLPKNDHSNNLRIITHVKKIKQTPGCKNLNKFFFDRFRKRKKNLFVVKLFLEFVVGKIGTGIKPLPCSPKLEAAWSKAVQLREKYGKLYFVKADITDAFNSVNYYVLTKILRCIFDQVTESGKIQLRKIIEWKKINSKIQKVVRFSFSNTVSENSVILTRSLQFHPNKEIDCSVNKKYLSMIKQIVMQQKIEINGKVYKLCQGLAQGSAGRFSTALCEIYYSAMDVAYFGKFSHLNDTILLRGVDDYLFISSSMARATEFLQIIQNGIPEYSVKFSNEKLKSNLLENIESVTYLGLIFDFDNMTVRPNYTKQLRNGLLSTINLLDKWDNNHFSKLKFLHKRSSQIVCLKLCPLVLNGVHNNLKIIRRIVFEASLMQCMRVLTLSRYLYSNTQKNEMAVYNTLLYSCKKIKNFVKSCQISNNEVNWLFFYAARCVLLKYSGVFKLVGLLIRYKFQKCEKEFAKDGDGFLCGFLKDDIINYEYWESLREVFRGLKKKPLKSGS